MEDRMAHRAVLGHFGKGHFGQQRRFEPVHALGFVTAGRVDHGGLFGLQGQQLLVDAFKGGFVEPGADLAGIA